MATIYPRGRKLWCTYYDAAGTRHCIASPYILGQEDLAKRFVDEVERQAKRGVDEETGVFTVRLYAKQWFGGRRERGLDSVDDDEAKITKHALPKIGAIRLSDLRPRHVRELVLGLKAKVGPGKEQLAPRTVRHVFATLHTMLADAVVDELVTTNPCVLKRDDLPKKVDKDPTWRASAIFTREEVEALISSSLIPEDRRVLYALLFLSGARFGEVSALRWSCYDKARNPLSHLLIAKSFNVHTGLEKSVKTQVTREVPVHPVLAKILAEWRLRGWEEMLGRAPGPDDLIIPSRKGRNRNSNHGLKRFHEDLDRLGLRHRRQHDARRTFITLARRDGARSDILEAITHGPRGDIMNIYTTLPWELLCEEVAKLKIDMRTGQLISLPTTAVIAKEIAAEANELLQSCYSPANVAILLGKNGGVDGTRNRSRSRNERQREEKPLRIQRAIRTAMAMTAPKTLQIVTM